ncbi:MAG: 50S ribosomal protein L21 [Candidatus Paceibacterota bacterium]|jgi:large subunit ribosomal protein L21
MKTAVIETGGKQYKVSEGQKLKIEKLAVDKDGKVIFDKVLLVADKDTKIGGPYLKGEKVEAKVVRQGRDKKKIVFRYHSKTRYRKKKGHRQPFTEVEITKV